MRYRTVCVFGLVAISMMCAWWCVPRRAKATTQAAIETARELGWSVIGEKWISRESCPQEGLKHVRIDPASGEWRGILRLQKRLPEPVITTDRVPGAVLQLADGVIVGDPEMIGELRDALGI